MHIQSNFVYAMSYLMSPIVISLMQITFVFTRNQGKHDSKVLFTCAACDILKQMSYTQCMVLIKVIGFEGTLFHVFSGRSLFHVSRFAYESV